MAASEIEYDRGHESDESVYTTSNLLSMWCLIEGWLDAILTFAITWSKVAGATVPPLSAGDSHFMSPAPARVQPCRP